MCYGTHFEAPGKSSKYIVRSGHPTTAAGNLQEKCPKHC